MGRRARPWLTWLVGAAILAAVVLVAMHVSEQRDFARLAWRAEPRWFAAALGLQAATYLCQSEVLQTVLRAVRAPLGVWETCKLTVARLFVDQALPFAGLSGTIVTLKALERRGVSQPVAVAGVVIDTASCHGAYALGLAAAMAIAALRLEGSRPLVLTAIPFLLFAAGISAGAVALAGRQVAGRVVEWLARLRPLRAGLELLAQSDTRLARSPRLLARATAWQVAVVLLDAATIWTLIHAVGAHAPPAGVFAAYVVSTMLRLVSVVPGGLGIFEGAQVLSLGLIGVDLPVALSATLLFRGLSFWLPMLPGLWFARRYARQTFPPNAPASTL
jgi:Mg2+-importing ATPase